MIGSMKQEATENTNTHILKGLQSSRFYKDTTYSILNLKCVYEVGKYYYKVTKQ